MALSYRKTVRDAAAALLAAQFNGKIETLSPLYGWEPFQLDFADGSENFRQEYVDPGEIERASFSSFPAACIYTADAEDMGASRGLPFDGSVTLCLEFFFRDRDGVPLSQRPEDLLDMTEAAALSIMNDPANRWPAGVIQRRQTSLPRQRMIPLGDGFATRVCLWIKFAVKVTSL